MKISLSNTLIKKEQCIDIDRKPFKMYVCGITPYDYAHLGHARCYIVFDVLFRLLKYLECQVIYCRNITDVEDKLINKSIAMKGHGGAFKEIADSFYKEFCDDLKALNCLQPTIEPFVTDNIDAIIKLIEKLIKHRNAYIVDDGVYFSVDSYPDYGRLAHRVLSEQIVGLRVQENKHKKNPLDFALWKFESHDPLWDSPWGKGRPGWHIECSALAYKYLGETIDIHGGGMDLIFPHHENERAQSESAHGKTFSHCWCHCAFIRVDHEKMSKSLNNFVTIKDVFLRYHPMILRYFVISHHYRSPLDFSWDALENAKKAYIKLTKLMLSSKKESCEFDLENNLLEEILHFLCDDLNTPGMLGVIFENAEHIKKNKQLAELVKSFLEQVCGLNLVDLPEEFEKHSPEVEILLEERERARQIKDWKRADELREKLSAMGIKVQDRSSKAGNE